jgi:hypothetical protein
MQHVQLWLLLLLVEVVCGLVQSNVQQELPAASTAGDSICQCMQLHSDFCICISSE